MPGCAQPSALPRWMRSGCSFCRCRADSRTHKLDASVRQQVDVLGCNCRLSDSRLETLELAECNHAPRKARSTELVAVPDAEQLKVNLRILVKRPRTRRTLGWARLHLRTNMRVCEDSPIPVSSQQLSRNYVFRDLKKMKAPASQYVKTAGSFNPA